MTINFNNNNKGGDEKDEKDEKKDELDDGGIVEEVKFLDLLSKEGLNIVIGVSVT